MKPKTTYYSLRGKQLVENLKRRHFDAYYCRDSAEALEKALELIPAGSRVGWGGATSADQIGLLQAVKAGKYNPIDRDTAATPAERERLMKECLTADIFISGANAISIDGQMVNIDGIGNRVAAIVYGPERVIIVAGMNKVTDSLEAAIARARTVAAPINKQRFPAVAGCSATGICVDCKAEGCICNQILITRNCKPAGRIAFILVGEELGF